MNILKFIKSLFIKDVPATITETTTLTTTAAPVAVLSGEAIAVPKRKKVIKRKK